MSINLRIRIFVHCYGRVAKYKRHGTYQKKVRVSRQTVHNRQKKLGLVTSFKTNTMSPARTSGTDVSTQDGPVIEHTNTTQSSDEALVDTNDGHRFSPSVSPQSSDNPAEFEDVDED